eukprot:gene12422-biopygen8584
MVDRGPTSPTFLNEFVKTSYRCIVVDPVSTTNWGVRLRRPPAPATGVAAGARRAAAAGGRRRAALRGVRRGGAAEPQRHAAAVAVAPRAAAGGAPPREEGRS